MQVSLTHHAYCIVGGRLLAESVLKSLESDHGISVRGNPDFFRGEYDTFTIDDARELKSRHELKPVHETSKKIFILAMDSITIEAQNALLKLLEEPSGYAHFFLIISSSHLLLPTVKSRLQFIEGGKHATKDLSEARKFLKMTPAKRLDQVKKLLDEISKEKKTKQDAIIFLNDLEMAVYEDVGTKKGMKALESIEFARKYANDRAPSMKMLLESIALAID